MTHCQMQYTATDDWAAEQIGFTLHDAVVAAGGTLIRSGAIGLIAYAFADVEERAIRNQLHLIGFDDAFVSCR